MNPIRLSVPFDPWRGTDYDAKISGHRVLILGESHYHSCEWDPGCKAADDRGEYHRSMTDSVVGRWAGGDKRSPLSHRLPAIFELEQGQFWRRVAFYNYLQALAGTGRADRPTSENWSSNAHSAAFQIVLDALKPDRMLVLGKSTWRNMTGGQDLFHETDPEPRLPVAAEFGKVFKGEEIGCWYHRADGGRTLAIPICHPAYPRFNWRDWVGTAQRLLQDY